MTNGERIRSLNDERLAEYLVTLCLNFQKEITINMLSQPDVSFSQTDLVEMIKTALSEKEISCIANYWQEILNYEEYRRAVYHDTSCCSGRASHRNQRGFGDVSGTVRQFSRYQRRGSQTGAVKYFF